MSKKEEAKSKKSTVIGKVVSISMDKTISVEIERKIKHPLYNKFISKTSRLMAHDEDNSSKIGDVVALIQSHPISKRKSWSLNKIIKEGKLETG
jgi:small subunit ribosomal protein S17